MKLNVYSRPARTVWHKLALLLASMLVTLMACTSNPDEARVANEGPGDHDEGKRTTHTPALITQMPQRESGPALEEITVSARKSEYVHYDMLSSTGSHPMTGKVAHDALAHLRMPAAALNRENYAEYERNAIQRVSETPVSTFSVDVDTGSYANIRRNA